MQRAALPYNVTRVERNRLPVVELEPNFTIDKDAVVNAVGYAARISCSSRSVGPASRDIQSASAHGTPAPPGGGPPAPLTKSIENSPPTAHIIPSRYCFETSLILEIG